MKKLLLLILIIFCSCEDNNIDGTWIGEYKIIELNGKQSKESLNTIIKIEDNIFSNQILGPEKDQKITSFEFTKSTIS